MGNVEGFTKRNYIVSTVRLIIRVIKSRRLRWTDHVVVMEESRSAFKFLAGTLAGKRPLERPKRIWDDSFRIYINEIGINTEN